MIMLDILVGLGVLTLCACCTAVGYHFGRMTHKHKEK